jgi:predicted alpha/beta hydrolase family esterase
MIQFQWVATITLTVLVLGWCICKGVSNIVNLYLFQPMGPTYMMTDKHYTQSDKNPHLVFWSHVLLNDKTQKANKQLAILNNQHNQHTTVTNPQPTTMFIYLHGNSEDISSGAALFEKMDYFLFKRPKNKILFLVPEYPGYSPLDYATTRPTEAKIKSYVLTTVLEAYANEEGLQNKESLKNEMEKQNENENENKNENENENKNKKNKKNEMPMQKEKKEINQKNHIDIIIVGRSLGTGVACWLVNALTEHGKSVHSVLLISPFSSIKDSAAEMVPKPISMWVSDKTFNSKEELKKWPLTTRLRLVHSEDDALFGPHHSTKLLNTYDGIDKKMNLVPGTHDSIDQFAAINQFVNEYFFLKV